MHTFDVISKFVIYFSLHLRLCYTILVLDTGWLLEMLYFLIIPSILKIIRKYLTQQTSGKLLWTSSQSTLYPLLGQILIVSYTRLTTMSFHPSLSLLIPYMTSLFLTLNDICDNRGANTFDFHSFLFADSYLMIRDLFYAPNAWRIRFRVISSELYNLTCSVHVSGP